MTASPAGTGGRPDRERETAEVRVRPLDTETLPDFLAFFDHDAFPDNPRWAFCYCQFFLEDHGKIVWPKQTAERNRDMACRRVAGGEMRGYLAYSGEQVVGWCNAGPRTLYRALDIEPVPDADDVGAIVCFVVAPSFRRRGVARALLEAACEGMAAQGLSIAEANPRPGATSDAEDYPGPLELYLSAGFSVHREGADGSVWVRRALGDAGA